ncbi:MAG: lysophospholipid acyltransferase family protein [Bdellovibrionota bacterium]
MSHEKSSIGLVMFSIYVWMVCFAWMFLLFVATVVVMPIFPYRRTHDHIAAPGFGFVLKLLFVDLHIDYDPQFDHQQRSVFCQNHVNLLDAFVASAAIPHVFCGLMHSWQFWIPIYGWMMRVSKGIAVPKKSGANRLGAIVEQAKKRKDMNFSILTFPEGHRTHDGKVHEFRKGMFVMAREAGYPVVPIAVHGNFAINQKGSFVFRPGKIRVKVGPQFPTAGLSDEQLTALAKKVQVWIKEIVEDPA